MWIHKDQKINYKENDTENITYLEVDMITIVYSSRKKKKKESWYVKPYLRVQEILND